jgi:hypothetical protein
MENALIDRDKLDYDLYASFIKTRAQGMLKKIGVRLQFTDADFQIDEDGDD